MPIISVVIYVGKEPWDGTRCLFDMMEIEDQRIIPFLNDYKLNIISAVEMSEEDFGKFHTDLGLVFRIIKHQKDDADKIIEETNHKRIDPDAAFFLRRAANLELEIERREDGIDMCEALEKRFKREEVTGAIKMLKLMKKEDGEIISIIIENYHVNKEYVLELMEANVEKEIQ